MGSEATDGMGREALGGVGRDRRRVNRHDSSFGCTLDIKRYRRRLS